MAINNPTVQFSVTRTTLGLGDLNINNRTQFIVASEILSSQVTYRRQQVRSPYVEGAITVNRVRDQVQDRIAIDVIGNTHAILQTNLTELHNAFAQDRFALTVQLDTAAYVYLCEAADYKMDFSVPRMHAIYTQVQFSFLRSPTPIGGPI